MFTQAQAIILGEDQFKNTGYMTPSTILLLKVYNSEYKYDMI